LNQRHHVANGIGGSQVDGIPFLQSRISGVIASCCSCRINQLTPFICIRLADELSYRDLVKVRIGIKFSPVFEGQFLGLDKGMYIVGTAKTHTGNIIAFQNIEYLQCSNSLSIRG